MDNDDLIKGADLQRIVDEGTEIYEQIKSRYEPKENGKILAIEVDSRQVYLGNTSVEAVELAKKHHPDKIFYIVKVGFDVVETIVRQFTGERAL